MGGDLAATRAASVRAWEALLPVLQTGGYISPIKASLTEQQEHLMMKYRSIDLFAVVAITSIAVALAFVVPAGNMPGRIFTLPLALVLPGYALISALFPKRELGGSERVVFSVGLSLIIVILGGLVLNLTPFGLRTNSWAVYLGAITLGASGVALIR